MARPSPAAFIAQVRAEASKVVWPTRKETMVTTLMVFVLSAIVATFFFVIDQFLGMGVQAVLNVGAG